VHDSYDLKFVGGNPIHERIRESAKYVSSCPVQVLRPALRRFHDTRNCIIQIAYESGACGFTAFGVPCVCRLDLIGSVGKELHDLQH
jgi:hypothetical protein